MSNAALRATAPSAIAGRSPVRLHRVEAAVQDQQPAVEDEPDREGLKTLGDDDGVLRGELAALVDEAHDRLGENDREEPGRDEEEGDLAETAVERTTQAGRVVPRGEPGERREEHGRHGDGEDTLREHVQAERLVDRGGRELGVEQPRSEQRVDEEVHVHEADRQRHRQHQDEHALHRRVAPVDDHRQPAVEAAQPRNRQEELHERPEHDDAGVEVQLPALVVDPRDAEEEPDDDHRVPGDRSECGEREVVVRVEDPHDDPGQAEEDDDREEDAGQPDGEVVVAARVAERAHEERREEDEHRGDPAEDQQRQPEERRCDAPCALALPLLEQLAEDRHEGARERRISDERAHEVRDLDRDRERVDQPDDAEEVRADHLAHEAEDA